MGPVPATGWLPQHLVLEATEEQRRSNGSDLSEVPLIRRIRLDHGWANAFERAGGSYYPKLQAAVPYSPVPGPRLLLRPKAPAVAGPALIAAWSTWPCGISVFNTRNVRDWIGMERAW